MDLKNKDYTFTVKALLEEDGIYYNKEARASYIINEISFHFNQPNSDFTYEYIEKENSIKITVNTDYARVMYILSMLPRNKAGDRAKSVHDKHYLSIGWKEVAEQFYVKGMIYMMAGYCPINDKQYLTLERKKP